MRETLFLIFFSTILRAQHLESDSAEQTCSFDDESCSNPTIIPKGANREGRPLEAPADCLDRHELCITFAAQGECTKNPGWMIVNCPISCNSCALRDPRLRCPRTALSMDQEPAYKPGDMNAMFSSILSNFGDKYGAIVHSESPWVVTFENFMTQEETDAIISTVHVWERSTDTGSTNRFGETGRILSQSRTSSNAWCREECESNIHVQNVLSRIEEITRIPSDNYESFQILKYEVGQKYNVHHDYGAQQKLLACGPRILTFFLYLSDVEEGGETAFPSLNITVAPRRGKALLWPSTLDEAPEEVDSRTIHAALPVIRGTKYAANSWIHLFNFRIPNLWGCTGTFDIL